MHSCNSVVIDGDLDKVYAYASDVEKWPSILPHYRSVKVLKQESSEQLVSMHCVRNFGLLKWPCKWTARLRLEPKDGRIFFRHVTGPARGMKVEWRLKPSSNGIETSIEHDLDAHTPWSKLYAGFIGPVFIASIAGETLARIKWLVESEVKE